MSGEQARLPGTEIPGRVPGTTYVIDTSKSVTEPPRQGRNGLTTRYCVTWCPLCGVRCGQQRGAWSQNEHGQWEEERKCSKCKKTYTLPLLPFEVKEAEVTFADPDFDKGEIG